MGADLERFRDQRACGECPGATDHHCSAITPRRRDALAALLCPRSHRTAPRQPRSRGGAATDVADPAGISSPRLEPEAASSRVKPACSLAFARLGQLNRPNHALPTRQVPRENARPCGRIRLCRLTSTPPSSSTTGSRGPSWPAPSRSKGVAVVTCPRITGPEPVWHSPFEANALRTLS